MIDEIDNNEWSNKLILLISSSKCKTNNCQ